MYLYEHKVQYYETDQMNIVNSANYVRWMEEARVDFFTQAGYPYYELEKTGLISPVVSMSCKYIESACFPDIVQIRTKLTYYNGIKMNFTYKMFRKKTGELLIQGNSSHCFLNEKRQLISLKKVNKKCHDVFEGKA